MAEIGRANGAVRALQALAKVVESTHAMEAFYTEHDFFLTPTIARKPVKIGELETAAPLQVAPRGWCTGFTAARRCWRPVSSSR